MIEKFIVKRDHVTRKNFSYAKEEVTLSFVLRVDVKKDLKAFLECLREAEKDVIEELNKL